MGKGSTSGAHHAGQRCDQAEGVQRAAKVGQLDDEHLFLSRAHHARHRSKVDEDVQEDHAVHDAVDALPGRHGGHRRPSDRAALLPAATAPHAAAVAPATARQSHAVADVGVPPEGCSAVSRMLQPLRVLRCLSDCRVPAGNVPRKCNMAQMRQNIRSARWLVRLLAACSQEYQESVLRLSML